MFSFKGAEYVTLVVLAGGAFAATYVATRAARQEAKQPEPVARAVDPPAERAPVSTAPSVEPAKEPGEAPAGMAWVPGGEFVMGTDEREAHPSEKPAHRVRVGGFWIDATEVTNAEFRRFVDAT